MRERCDPKFEVPKTSNFELRIPPVPRMKDRQADEKEHRAGYYNRYPRCIAD